MIKKLISALLAIFKGIVEEQKQEAIEAEKIKGDLKEEVSSIASEASISPDLESHIKETEKKKESILEMKKKAGLLSVLLMAGTLCFGMATSVNAQEQAREKEVGELPVPISTTIPSPVLAPPSLSSVSIEQRLQLLLNIIKAQDEVIDRQSYENNILQTKLDEVAPKLEALNTKIDSLTVKKKTSKFQTLLKYSTIIFPPIFTIFK